MKNNCRIIAIIPAKGGSKGIPNKNIRLVCKKPLIYYTINAAKQCKFIDDIIISTDSKKIASVAAKYGCRPPFLRPAFLASDKSKTIDCIIYTLKKLMELGYHYDILVILQPTSPLRTSDDINKAIELYFKYNENVISVNEIDTNPFLLRTVEKNKLRNLLNSPSTIRRQDLLKYYKVNGAIYINNIEKLNKNTSLNDNKIGFIMNKNHSTDIDSINDLNLVRKILKKDFNKI